MTVSARGGLVPLADFQPAGGHCFTAALPPGVPPGDSMEDPCVSPLILFEDDVALGPAHSLHAEIRDVGQGRFSHWNDTLYFSCGDNSDPRRDDRRYQIYAPPRRAGPVQRAQALLNSLADNYAPQQAYEVLERCFATLYPAARLGEDLKSFWNDTAFIAAYHALVGDNYRALERKYTIYNLVRSLHWLDGDIAECGTYNGSTAYFMALAGQQSGRSRHMHLFDSFAGLSPPGREDGSYWRAGDLACTEAETRRNLARFADIHLLQGWIPSRFPVVADRHFGFVHIDVDIYQPTRDSIEFFFPRLRPGGMLVCDDYGFDSCPGARRAMDDFFSTQREQIIHLPTGQGLVIKLQENTSRTRQLEPHAR